MAKPNQNVTIDDEPIVKAEGGAPPEGDGGEGGDEEKDDEDEDEDENEDAEKSDLTEATLVKALDEMDSIALSAANGVTPRQRELAAKLSAGTPLNKSERAELAAVDEPLAKSHKETFVSDPTIAQGFEVSEFLDATMTKVAESLDDNRNEMNKSFAELGEFNRTLAKSLNALGAVVIEQHKKIRKLEKALGGEAPKAAPQAAEAKGRSAVGQRVNDGGAIRKSGNGAPEGTKLTREVILGALDELMEKSEGRQGIVDGVDITFESSRYETTHMLSPDAMRLVCKTKGVDPASVGLSG